MSLTAPRHLTRKLSGRARILFAELTAASQRSRVLNSDEKATYRRRLDALPPARPPAAGTRPSSVTLLAFWVAVVTFLHPAPAVPELTAFIVSATPKGCELARASWLEDPAVSVSACTLATLGVSLADAVLRPSP